MCDVEKVRKGLALLIGGIAVSVVAVLLTDRVPNEAFQVVSALVFAGVIAAAVGLFWIVTGLWHGDREKV